MPSAFLRTQQRDRLHLPESESSALHPGCGKDLIFLALSAEEVGLVIHSLAHSPVCPPARSLPSVAPEPPADSESNATDEAESSAGSSSH